MIDREECQRCGRSVPPRLAGSGFCTKRCARKQAAEDEASMASEREYDVDDGDYIAARVAERDDIPPSPFD